MPDETNVAKIETPPQVDVSDLCLKGNYGRGASYYRYSHSTHDLLTITRPGYFNVAANRGLTPGDRIDCAVGAKEPQDRTIADLVICQVRKPTKDDTVGGIEVVVGIVSRFKITPVGIVLGEDTTADDGKKRGQKAA